jgi:hypothetical protein
VTLARLPPALPSPRASALRSALYVRAFRGYKTLIEKKCDSDKVTAKTKSGPLRLAWYIQHHFLFVLSGEIRRQPCAGRDRPRIQCALAFLSGNPLLRKAGHVFGEVFPIACSLPISIGLNCPLFQDNCSSPLVTCCLFWPTTPPSTWTLSRL